jgi:mono/diheme cytochrome c family protein
LNEGRDRVDPGPPFPYCSKLSKLNPIANTMKRILKIVGLVLLGLVGLLIVVALFFQFRTSSRMDQRFEIQPVLTSVVADSATLVRGEHVMEIESCQNCHGENLGGKVMMDMPLWRMTAPNLTSGNGGLGRTYTVADWDRAIRSGVGIDGHALMIMPVEVYKNLSDEDANALIAYLEQIEPVDSDLEEVEIRFLGAVMLGAGNFDPAETVVEPGSAPKVTPDPEATGEFGGYLASTMCTGCHGEDLAGTEADNPSCPAPPSLVASGAWDLDEFVTTIRTGVNPGGLELDKACMPWTSFKEMTDVEIDALHQFVRAEARMSE